MGKLIFIVYKFPIMFLVAESGIRQQSNDSNLQVGLSKQGGRRHRTEVRRC